jgi:hypothetical protein
MRRQRLWWSLDKGLVGEFVRQQGQLAFGEFQHPALREYHPLLAASARAAGMTWKKDPSRWPWYRITLIAKDCP